MSMTRRTAVLLAVAVAATSVYARSPREGNYVPVAEGGGLKVSVDSLGLWGPKGGKERGISFFWQRWDALTPDGRQALAKLAGPLATGKISNLATAYVRLQIDCKTRRYGLMSMSGHDARGEFLFDSYTKPLSWSKVPAGDGPTAISARTACAAPYTALPGNDSNFRGLTRSGAMTRPDPVDSQPPPPVSRPAPAAQRCINPATGREMLDPNGYCIGNDVGGSRYGEDGRSPMYLTGVPGFDPHAK